VDSDCDGGGVGVGIGRGGERDFVRVVVPSLAACGARRVQDVVGFEWTESIERHEFLSAVLLTHHCPNNSYASAAALNDAVQSTLCDT